VLGLVVSACTSSADADVDPELAAMSARARASSEEKQAERLITNFFRAIQERNHYALYALFAPDDECRPGRIEELLVGVTPGIAETSEVEVDDVSMRPIGNTYSVAFTLIEHQGAAEKELVYEEFFPIEETGSRWRFSADLCEWLAAPDGDAGVQQEMGLALEALQLFFADNESYLASDNDLRYYASGLNITLDELALMPGEVLLASADQQALLIGQGITGGWYCIAVADGFDPRYGSGPTFEDVAFLEACLDGSSTGGW
jgi:muconolactone delta-isomerase